MPEPTVLLVFVLASLAILIVPGPTIALVVTRSLAQGPGVALPLVAGVGLGDLVAASLALTGAGAILAASAVGFTFVKIAGAAYLIWIGLKLALSRQETIDVNEPASASRLSRAAFRDAFLVTVLNPKGILFFIAFVPPFIDPSRDYLTQAALFVLLFTFLGVVNGVAYATFANFFGRVIRRPSVLTPVRRAGGFVIVMAGIAALFARRTPA